MLNVFNGEFITTHSGCYSFFDTLYDFATELRKTWGNARVTTIPYLRSPIYWMALSDNMLSNATRLEQLQSMESDRWSRLLDLPLKIQMDYKIEVKTQLAICLIWNPIQIEMQQKPYIFYQVIKHE